MGVAVQGWRHETIVEYFLFLPTSNTTRGTVIKKLVSIKGNNYLG